MSVRTTMTGIALAALLLPATAQAEERWPDIKEMLFEGREILPGTDILALDAPYRAFDAATVPVAVKDLTAANGETRIAKLHLIIDQNPAPVVFAAEIGEAAGDASLETRVRINEYTDVRAVAETEDGALHMVQAYVKAAGGCSAPGLKDPEVALARLGKMKFKTVGDFAAGQVNEGRLLISHPNYTGLQIDQLTRNWIPPDYIDRIEIDVGGRDVLRLDTDISISEDPALTFHFVPEAAGEVTVRVHDIEDRAFERSWPVGSGV